MLDAVACIVPPPLLVGETTVGLNMLERVYEEQQHQQQHDQRDREDRNDRRTGTAIVFRIRHDLTCRPISSRSNLRSCLPRDWLLNLTATLRSQPASTPAGRQRYQRPV